ncbi:MAG: response regulator transcription factor [Opitutales bacterium]|nr:response regulator transcription factor [Opitutales bacterium]
MTSRILIIEDDEAIRDVVRYTLENNGFENVLVAADGAEGLALATRERPALILLDLMLPKIDGLEVCRRLKRNEATREIPIVMLTAKSEESDIVLGLELGAVDYITKPFSAKVLVARIRAHLRQVFEQENAVEIRRAGLVLNTEEHSARIDGKPLDLTFTEFGILQLLASRPGRVYTRDQIVSRVKGDDYPVTDRAIDVQMVNLRRKLGEWATHIETVRGVGYRMKSES